MAEPGGSGARSAVRATARRRRVREALGVAARVRGGGGAGDGRAAPGDDARRDHRRPAQVRGDGARLRPDVGKRLADEMLKKHRVHFVSGIIWSNVMLAVAPVVTREKVLMIGTNAGPHELAGEQCSEYFFTTSWQNDQTPEAMGKYMQDQGLQDVYAMAPNYAAGKDMISGFKRYFQGRIVNEVYTKLGQQDYSAEITQVRAANPKAVFVFYPGDMGIQFVKQYA